MVSKCANPECSAAFRYFHVGKLYRMETSSGHDRRRSMGSEEAKSSTPLRHIEFYWLCESCAPKMTLVFERHTGVSVRASSQSVPVAAAASAAA